MKSRLEELMHDVDRNPGASQQTIASFVREVGEPLPEDYLAWMELSDGGEGFVGPISYLILWRLSEVVERNRRLDVSALAPGLLLFGSNGGDAAYAFDRRLPSAVSVVELPYVDLGQENALRPCGDGFLDFLETLAQEE